MLRGIEADHQGTLGDGDSGLGCHPLARGN
jgi:hypothetical protein